MIHIVLGTKAQYIKTAPVVRELDRRHIPYRLIDTGQHAAIASELRGELDVREPDVRLADGGDIVSIPQAARWALRLAARLVDGRALRRELFDDRPGVCLVHGDTPSTLLAALMARRAGVPIAHLEAGLRSRSLFHPFPEELIRVVVMRMSQLLFAPDETSARNLERMGLADRTVRTSGNTVIDALRHSLGELTPTPSGPAIATMHRVENLHNAERVRGWERTVAELQQVTPVRVVTHGPTAAVLDRSGTAQRLRTVGVELVPLLPHQEFTRALAAAPAVITDGGSVQEECALLGVPTLLWRGRTERDDGLGENVVLSGYDEARSRAFVQSFGDLRVPPKTLGPRPAAAIVDELVARGHADG